MAVLYFFLAVVAGFIIFSITARISRNRKSRANVRSQWGRIPAGEYTSNDYASMGCYYNNIKTKDGRFFIDDITWNDLDMNRVFSKINNTQTDIGEEYLYYLLRELIYDQDKLLERNALVEYFRNNAEEREKLQILLSELGKMRFLSISDYLCGKRNGIGKSGLFYKILAAVFIITPFISAVYPPALFLFMASLVLNVTMYFKAREQIIGHLQSLGYIVNMISTSKRIAKLPYKDMEKYTGKLRRCSGRIRGLSLNNFFSMFYSTENYFLELIKIFFLGEPIAYHSIFKLIDKYREELWTIYETLGELDALTAVASYRESLEYYTTPVLRKDGGGNRSLSFTELYHPLIKNPVPNTFNTSKTAIITGSNASGKSTFLKSVAINAIFAQTIYTCLAREYSSCFFNIYSSMALNDNLEGKESYYIVEIKSLKRIIGGLSPQMPCLCVIDEVLRGTNTIERIAASSEIMSFISKSNCICLCATHDIELTQMLSGSVDNYHFQEFFQEEKISFDYKIYPGESTTRNAIKLLRFLGYEENIVRNAEERAELFIKNGGWEKVDGNEVN